MWNSPDPWAQAASRHGVAWAPCRDGKPAVLIGLRLGRGPPGLGLAFAVKSSQECLWRIPAVPGGPAALNLASQFSILSAGFVVVTPLQVTQMAILRRPMPRPQTSLIRPWRWKTSRSLLLSLSVNFSRCILQRPRRYHDEKDCIRLLTDNPNRTPPQRITAAAGVTCYRILVRAETPDQPRCTPGSRHL